MVDFSTGKQEITMLTSNEADCIRLANDCATACNVCASECLKSEDPKAMATCVSHDLECAELCRVAAGSIARGGPNMKAICALCAAACRACAGACGTHDMEHCKRCAEACRKCADACSAMA